MPKVPYVTEHMVQVIESERGWGQDYWDPVYFETKEEALEYVREFNKNLPKDHVPDYYIMAQYERR